MRTWSSSDGSKLQRRSLALSTRVTMSRQQPRKVVSATSTCLFSSLYRQIALLAGFLLLRYWPEVMSVRSWTYRRIPARDDPSCCAALISLDDTERWPPADVSKRYGSRMKEVGRSDSPATPHCFHVDASNLILVFIETISSASVRAAIQRLVFSISRSFSS